MAIKKTKKFTSGSGKAMSGNNTLHHSRNNIPVRIRAQNISILNKTLATLSDLYANIKQAHWNVKGPQFYSLHLMFDQIAEEVENQVDIVAERITSLGGTALGTIAQANKNSELTPYPTNIYSGKEHLERLAMDFAKAAEHARDNIKVTENLGDMGTSDVYIDLTRLLDLRMWFIEAHLQSAKDIDTILK